MSNIPEILFEEPPGHDGHLGLITLNRPQALNALNHNMFLALDKQLTAWAQDKHIKAVVIRAVEGRAFCAGGDIRYAYEKKSSNDSTLPHFFRDEYRLNRHIYHFPKPYIALLDGITMGGGAGISIHGSHRVATERLVFAMPETGIGFYPDIGASYFLSRLPYKMGFYLALTGARISYKDCLAIGLVDAVVAHADQDKLIAALVAAPLKNKLAVTEIIKSFSIASDDSILMTHKNAIENYFALHSVEEIISALESDKNTWDKSTWCHETAASIKTRSPTSLKVTLRELQEGSKLNFDDCMRMEYRLTNRFIKGHDFFEGVRAAVIDKDQKPHWRPATLEEVTLHQIENYFAPLKEELA